MSLNDIPAFSVFMPITIKFAKSFIKVLGHIFLILFIYAYIFYLLFKEQHSAFQNIWYSMIKSTVWVLGDLGYDDMFLDDSSPVIYPVMSNLIFLIFVTSISGFIINLIITQPAEHLDSFRNDAAYYKVSSRIQMMLKYDQLFHSFYRPKSVSKINLDLNNLGYPTTKTNTKLSFLKRVFSQDVVVHHENNQGTEETSASNNTEHNIKELVEKHDKLLVEISDIKIMLGKLLSEEK